MQKKLNLLIISHSSGRYGAEKSLLLLLENIDRNRFNPVVVFPSEGPLKEQVDQLGIRSRVVWIPWWIKTRLQRLDLPKTIYLEIKAQILLRLIIISEKIDLIYSNTMVIFAGAFLAKLTGLPHVWHIREILPRSKTLGSILPAKWVLKWIPMQATLLIANSRATLQQFECQEDAKHHIVYNAIQVPDNFRHNPKNPLESFEVLFIGSIIPRKGPEVAIEAVAMVRERKNANYPIRLTLAGGGSEIYKRQLLQLCQQKKISDCVDFLGYVNNAYEHMARSHVLLVPSYEESWGRVAVEAMQIGLPVIGANSGGLCEIIKDGRYGYTAQAGNIEEWALKIEQVINNYSDALKNAQRAQAYAKEEFTVKQYVSRIESSLEQFARQG